MGLTFQESLPESKLLILGLSSAYFKQKSIGNRKVADKLEEALKALHIYVSILDYYYTDLNAEIPIQDEDIKRIYSLIKQIYFTVKPSYYGS